MDLVTAILISSILGGLTVGWLITRLQGRGTRSLADAPMDAPGRTDLINISHIRAAGIGGLGLFAMALVVAWFVPRIGMTLMAGVLLGALLGAVIILRRRHTGPLPSSGASAGANVVLSIDQPAAHDKEDADTHPNELHVAVARRAI